MAARFFLRRLQLSHRNIRRYEEQWDLSKNFPKQFRHPVGFWGYIAGKLMAMSTGERNEWTLSLLDIQPNDRVLEIGYGPG